MKALVIRIDDEQHKKLREIAYLRSESMNTLVKEALDELFKLWERGK